VPFEFKILVLNIRIYPMHKKSYTISEARLKAEHYCIYQDRCQYELEVKLKEMGMIPLAVDEILIDLIQNDFVNEERFARSYTRGKYRIMKWGRIKIKQGLKAKRISDYCIKKGWEEIDLDEYFTILEQLAQSKWAVTKGSNYEKYGKVKRFLWSRGFETDLISEVLSVLVEN